ncbi:phospholipase D-like domain-containing protein [Helicobacter sp. 11S02629-2]|uniref:phospholipase D-like domain-containing protein n=1 Tax=Helicobacter sp. 11S02629-2 TaxID=1476195 RepID=UPI000BA6FD54|nr:phospholipase D-like domain-containing protein [Helicobacter sp. 11S02629-2]PAF44943.1 hypothetical protein BKH40_04455 [Helicobacter sp. 11S02629-2]
MKVHKTARVKKSFTLLSFFIVFVLFSLSKTYSYENLYMLPYQNKEALKELVQSIRYARKDIKIAIYSFTYRPLINALKDAASRGVKVHIIFDNGNLSEDGKPREHSALGDLAKYRHIDVCTLKGLKDKRHNYYGIMHQKLIVIDDKLLALGSANWSKNAFELSYETLLFTDNAASVKTASYFYKDMFSRCKLYG